MTMAVASGPSPIPTRRRGSRALRAVGTLLALTVGLAVVGFGSARAQSADGPQPDEFYAGYLAADGLAIIERRDGDLTGDGVAETVLVAFPEECGSCRLTRVMVFSGTTPMADVPDLDDAAIEVREGGPVLIQQPIRLLEESRGAPSGSYVLELRYDASSTEADGVGVPGRFVFGPSVTVRTEPNPGGPPGNAPRHAVVVYYGLLNVGRYEQAYDLLTDDFRQAAPYESWEREARSRGSRRLLEVARVPQTFGRVRVQVQETDRASGAVTRRYGGTWQTNPVDDTGYNWRLSQFDAE